MQWYVPWFSCRSMSGRQRTLKHKPTLPRGFNRVLAVRLTDPSHSVGRWHAVVPCKNSQGCSRPSRSAAAGDLYSFSRAPIVCLAQGSHRVRWLPGEPEIRPRYPKRFPFLPTGPGGEIESKVGLFVGRDWATPQPTASHTSATRQCHHAALLTRPRFHMLIVS